VNSRDMTMRCSNCNDLNAEPRIALCLECFLQTWPSGKKSPTSTAPIPARGSPRSNLGMGLMPKLLVR